MTGSFFESKCHLPALINKQVFRVFHEKFDLSILAHGEVRARPLLENSSGNFEHVPYHFTHVICSDKSISLRFVGAEECVREACD